jgi:hypothetical protein
MRRIRRAMWGTIPAILLLAGSAEAQALLDWPVRQSVEVDALAAGAVATFWNPAGTALGGGRGEAVLLDLQGPRETGVTGMALAASWRWTEVATFGVGLRHLGVRGIAATSTTPDPDVAELAVGESRFAVSAARRLGGGITAGVVGDLAQASDAAGGARRLSWGGGATYESELRLRPRVAARALVGEGGVAWSLGGEVAAYDQPDWTVRVGYGAGGNGDPGEALHRLAASATWTERVSLAAALLGTARGRTASWEPQLSARLNFGRYGLGVVREGMPNDFGAAYHYHLRVGF